MEQLETDQMHQITFFITTPSRLNQKQTFTNILAMQRIWGRGKGSRLKGREEEKGLLSKNKTLNKMYTG